MRQFYLELTELDYELKTCIELKIRLRCLDSHENIRNEASYIVNHSR